MEEFSIRAARREDVGELLRLIRALAAYERMAHEVTAGERDLVASLFGERPAAEAVLGECGGRAVAFAVFFHNFSTFRGRAGLYLEDLFVEPECRGRGYGYALLGHLAKIAVARGCVRMEWAVLDWNKPAWNFYARLGARPLADWTLHRLADAALADLAAGSGG
ncbi:MAG: GNAT family N-acetyltransferase [Gammaproteobacteria bacterium]|nr:GNAT family N-acetyltransferase [Gammaproteobacteria bacterium]